MNVGDIFPNLQNVSSAGECFTKFIEPCRVVAKSRSYGKRSAGSLPEFARCWPHDIGTDHSRKNRLPGKRALQTLGISKSILKRYHQRVGVQRWRQRYPGAFTVIGFDGNQANVDFRKPFRVGADLETASRTMDSARQVADKKIILATNELMAANQCDGHADGGELDPRGCPYGTSAKHANFHYRISHHALHAAQRRPPK